MFSSIAGLGFIISREKFNNLMTIYFIVPTNHMQKLQITLAKIKCKILRAAPLNEGAVLLSICPLTSVTLDSTTYAVHDL